MNVVSIKWHGTPHIATNDTASTLRQSISEGFDQSLQVFSILFLN